MHLPIEPNRRIASRYLSVFRICSIETAGERCFAVLRNVSDNGAQIESSQALPVGTTIYYSLDGSTAIEAEVKWCQNGRIGLRNKSDEPHTGPEFPRRAARISTVQDGEAWVDGKRISVRIENLSQRGARVIGLPVLSVGKPIFLKFAALELEFVTVRWSNRDTCGVRFAKPLHIKELNAALTGAKAHGSGMSFPARGDDTLRSHDRACARVA